MRTVLSQNKITKDGEGEILARSRRLGGFFAMFTRMDGMFLTICLFAAATAVVMIPAIINGYPFIFWDSGEYIVDGLGSGVPHEKALPYALFVALTSMRHSLWLVIISQTGLTLYAMHCVSRLLPNAVDRVTAGLFVLILVACTPMAWSACHVMPDIFAADTILCLYVVLFSGQRLSRAQLFCVSALLVLSSAVHNSHLLLCAVMLLGSFLAGWLTGWRFVARRRVAAGFGLLCASVVLIIGMNLARTGELYLFKQGYIYQVNLLTEEGITQKLLADHCKDYNYLFCAYQPLPTERMQMIIDPDSPLYRSHALRPENKAAVTKMIFDSIRYYPFDYMLASLGEIWTQLTSFDLVRYIFVMAPEPKLNPDHFGMEAARVLQVLQHYFPAEYHQFATSLQQSGDMPPGWLADLLADAHAGSFWLACGIIIVLWRLHVAGVAQLTGFVGVALVVNACICALLSHAEFRYQARVIWLVPYCALLGWHTLGCGRGAGARVEDSHAT